MKGFVVFLTTTALVCISKYWLEYCQLGTQSATSFRSSAGFTPPIMSIACKDTKHGMATRVKQPAIHDWMEAAAMPLKYISSQRAGAQQERTCCALPPGHVMQAAACANLGGGTDPAASLSLGPRRSNSISSVCTVSKRHELLAEHTAAGHVKQLAAQGCYMMVASADLRVYL